MRLEASIEQELFVNDDMLAPDAFDATGLRFKTCKVCNRHARHKTRKKDVMMMLIVSLMHQSCRARSSAV